MGRNIDKEKFKFIAGRPCLDFVNTQSWQGRDPFYERFNHYDDLLRWGHQAELLANEEVEALYRRAARQPAAAAAVFERGLALREIVYRIFAAVAIGQTPGQTDLADLNRSLAAALPHLGVVRIEARFEWGWLKGRTALERPLWPVAYSAAALLISPDANKIGRCAGPGCGWLFLDFSRNHSRRWCAMNDCGNRAKARRHYHQLTINNE